MRANGFQGKPTRKTAHPLRLRRSSRCLQNCQEHRKAASFAVKFYDPGPQPPPIMVRRGARKAGPTFCTLKETFLHNAAFHVRALERSGDWRERSIHSKEFSTHASEDSIRAWERSVAWRQRSVHAWDESIPSRK